MNLEKNWYKLDEEDAARLFLYRSLSSSKDYAFEEKLKNGAGERLGLNDVITENTIERISEEIKAQIDPDVIHRLREIVEQLEDNDEIVTLPAATADGRGEPELIFISRQLHKLAYQFIQLDRDESRVTYPKCQLFKLMEIAGLCNIHPNDAEASHRFLPYFYYRDAPGFKNTLEPASRRIHRFLHGGSLWVSRLSDAVFPQSTHHPTDDSAGGRTWPS